MLSFVAPCMSMGSTSGKLDCAAGTVTLYAGASCAGTSTGSAPLSQLAGGAPNTCNAVQQGGSSSKFTCVVSASAPTAGNLPSGLGSVTYSDNTCTTMSGATVAAPSCTANVPSTGQSTGLTCSGTQQTYNVYATSTTCSGTSTAGQSSTIPTTCSLANGGGSWTKQICNVNTAPAPGAAKSGAAAVAAGAAAAVAAGAAAIALLA